LILPTEITGVLGGLETLIHSIEKKDAVKKKK